MGMSLGKIFSASHLLLASRSAMHFFKALISVSTCSSKHFRSGPACSFIGVSECLELNLSNTLSAFLVTIFVLGLSFLPRQCDFRKIFLLESVGTF